MTISWNDTFSQLTVNYELYIINDNTGLLEDTDHVIKFWVIIHSDSTALGKIEFQMQLNKL